MFLCPVCILKTIMPIAMSLRRDEVSKPGKVSEIKLGPLGLRKVTIGP